MRAAIYARVSSDKQDTEDKTSLSEQLADCRTYAAERGHTVVAEYSEVGRGWSKNRREFRQMLADALVGRFDIVVCWKADRLSRGMYPAAALMEVLEACGVQLEAVMDTIDMKTFGLMAAIGKIELDNFRERAGMGKRGSARRGRIPSSSLPFGYRIGADGRAEIVEEEAEVVRQLFTMYAGGANIETVMAEAEGLTGRRWSSSQAHRLLKQPAYAGTWTYGKTRRRAVEGGTVITEQPESEWITVPVPPIVSEALFDKVQRLKQRRKKESRRSTRNPYMLSKLVTCGVCGTLMGGVTKASGRAPISYYRCYGLRHLGLRCREKSYIRADRLEALVWREVKELLADPFVLCDVVDGDDGSAAIDADIAAAESNLAKMVAEEDRIIRLYAMGKLTEPQLERQRRFITDRMESARLVLDDLRKQRAAAIDRVELADSVRAWVTRILEGLDELDDEGRRDLLRLILDGATIDEDGCIRMTVVLAPQPT